VQSWLWSAFPADIRYDGVAVIQQWSLRFKPQFHSCQRPR
jgi:hypothetical protein